MRVTCLLAVAATAFFVGSASASQNKLSNVNSPDGELSIHSVDAVNEKRFLRTKDDDEVEEDRISWDGKWAARMAEKVNEGMLPSTMKRYYANKGWTDSRKQKYNLLLEAFLKKNPGGFNRDGLN